MLSSFPARGRRGDAPGELVAALAYFVIGKSLFAITLLYRGQTSSPTCSSWCRPARPSGVALVGRPAAKGEAVVTELLLEPLALSALET